MNRHIKKWLMFQLRYLTHKPSADFVWELLNFKYLQAIGADMYLPALRSDLTKWAGIRTPQNQLIHLRLSQRVDYPGLPGNFATLEGLINNPKTEWGIILELAEKYL